MVGFVAVGIVEDKRNLIPADHVIPINTDQRCKRTVFVLPVDELSDVGKRNLAKVDNDPIVGSGNGQSADAGLEGTAGNLTGTH